MLLASTLFVLAQATAPVTPAAAAKPAVAGPQVVFETSLGRFKLQLDQAKAPITVKNFLEYVRAGHYDGTVFHRVIPGFMVQGGGMQADMSERPTRPAIKNEAKNGLRNLRGTISMARLSEPNSATAQFFINVKDNAALDFGINGAGYAVFGEVVEGMDVVDRIVAVPTTSKGQYQNVPATPVEIVKAREVGAAPAPKPAAVTAPKPAAKPTAVP